MSEQMPVLVLPRLISCCVTLLSSYRLEARGKERQRIQKVDWIDTLSRGVVVPRADRRLSLK